MRIHANLGPNRLRSFHFSFHNMTLSFHLHSLFSHFKVWPNFVIIIIVLVIIKIIVRTWPIKVRFEKKRPIVFFQPVKPFTYKFYRSVSWSLSKRIVLFVLYFWNKRRQGPTVFFNCFRFCFLKKNKN